MCPSFKDRFLSRRVKPESHDSQKLVHRCGAAVVQGPSDRPSVDELMRHPFVAARDATAAGQPARARRASAVIRDSLAQEVASKNTMRSAFLAGHVRR
jgi:hypothetical protein